MIGMSKIIDFHTGKPIDAETAMNAPEPAPAPQQYSEEMQRRINLIHREVYEAIGACLSQIDGEEYTFLNWLEDSGVYEMNAISEGGYLSDVDRTLCYDLSKILAPFVDEFAKDLKETMFGSV